MHDGTKIVILGGDLRFQSLADKLGDKYSVKLYNNQNNISLPDIKLCDFLILPLPATQGNSTIISSMENTDLRDIFPLLKSSCVVLSGKISEKTNLLAKNHNINIYNYYTDEFETLNAIPSAEGAIEIAMNQTDFTLCGSKILVLGFGRIGKTLSKMLSGLGADITVCARRAESLALAKALGFKNLNLKYLSSQLGFADIVFNTIPSMIMDKENLNNTKKDVLIIDLASKPGGVDFDYASSLGIKTIHALGLPAKTSPKTSSNILSDCICSFIEERRTNGT